MGWKAYYLWKQREAIKENLKRLRETLKPRPRPVVRRHNE